MLNAERLYAKNPDFTPEAMGGWMKSSGATGENRGA